MIRLATAADVPQLAEIHYWSIQSLADVLPAAYVQARTVTDFEKIWLSNFEILAAERKSTWIVAPTGSEPCGLISAGPPVDDDLEGRHAGLIGRLYVLPASKGTGLGKRLILHGLDSLRRRKFDEAILWVFGENKHARRFYELQGFTPDGTTKQAYGELLIRYRLSL